MRVLVITSWFPTSKHPGYSFTQRDVEMLARDHDVTVLHLCPPSLIGDATSAPDTQLASGGAGNGYRVVQVPFAYNNPWLTYRAAKAIRRMSASHDLVHTMALHSLLPTRLSRPGLPWVHTEHSSALVVDPSSKRQAISLGFLTKQFSGPLQVVAVGEGLARALRGHTKAEPTVIGNYVRIPSVDAATGGGDEEVRLIGVGNVIPQKGPDLFVQTVAALRDKGVPVRATWVGEGPLRSEMESLAEELGVQDSVDFVGHVDPVDLPQLLGRATVFVLPTQSETYGVAIAEALAAGLPVVVTGTGEFSKFLPEEASRHVGVRKVENIVTAVEDLLNDPKAWGRKKIAQYAAEVFDESRRRKAYAEVYGRALIGAR